MSETETSYIDSESVSSQAPTPAKQERKPTIKTCLTDLVLAKSKVIDSLKEDQKVTKVISDDFSDLADLIDTTISDIQNNKSLEQVVTDLSFIAQQIRDSSLRLKNHSEKPLEPNWADFDKKFDDFQTNFANAKAFHLLGVAKFGKPKKPREERACKRCHQNSNPNDLPSNFHTTLECPDTGYDRVYPPKRERGFVILKDNYEANTYYPVEVVCMKGHIFEK